MKNTYSKNKKSKSFASVVLAGLLTLSFNSAPILSVSERINQANAYKSTQTEVYYPTTTTTTESKISSANYPNSLQEFFSDSSNNFNIQSFYNEMFEEYFISEVNKFFTNNQITQYFDSNNKLYNTNLATFLQEKGNFASLHDYYLAVATEYNTKYNITSYKTFVEYFVSQNLESTSLTEGGNRKLIENTTNDERAKFYCMLSNYLLSEQDSVGDDGVTDETNFYGQSHQYSRFKNYIDSLVVETFAIYSYDGETQNDNVASIIAKNAPKAVDYTYVSNSYTTYVNQLSNLAKSENKLVVYYFGLATDLTGKSITDSENVEMTYQNASEKSNVNILYYKLTKVGQPGYVGENFPTYYKYTNNTPPYQQTNSYYNVYVLNNDLTQSQKDTYDSIYYNVITDADNPAAADSLYVNVPYQEDQLYFKAVYNNSLYNPKFSFEQFCDYFTDDAGNSILYLKVTSENAKYVYINPSDYDAFVAAFPNYAYKLVKKEISEDEGNLNDYYKVTSSFSDYYKKDFNLYFEKTKQYFYNSSISATANFEMTTVSNVAFEKTEMPALSFETETEGGDFVIYVIPNGTNQTSFTEISAEDLNDYPYFFVKVPEAEYITLDVSPDEYTLYYKHNTIEVNSLYVIDDKDDSEYLEIYKTLGYKVLKTKELETNYTNFLVVGENDENYNKNFKLYYRYLRDVQTETVYVLDDDFNDTNVKKAIYSSNSYVQIGSGELTNYCLIESGDPNYSEEYKLYYRLSDVFVQNELKCDNAIYVVDDDVTSSDRQAYSLNFYTVISSAELKDNPSLYVPLTQTDANYSTTYTKLYYKYLSTTTTKKIYNISEIDKSSADYSSLLYQLIESGDTNYIAGVEQYYKYIAQTTNTPYSSDTYYYYNTATAVTLNANSYYVVSFYVNTTGDDTEASFYIKDTKKVMSDIKIENISTNGKWQKYYVFISTDALLSSSINLYLYLGDETHGIVGSKANTTLTGSVLFDEIKVISIGLTDYNKKAIDDVKVYDETKLYNEQANQYADDYGNRVFVANSEITSNTYEYKIYANNDIGVFSTYSWDDMFDFDKASLKEYLDSTKTENLKPMTTDIDGYSMYDNMTDLWRYYISRSVSGQKHNFGLSQYQQAYINNDLIVSITNEIDEQIIEPEEETEDEEETEGKDDDKEDEKEEEDKEDENDVKYIASPFKDNNYALRLENKNRNIPLGITSNSFTVAKNSYYKITLWVYSPNKEGTASVSLNSILKTNSTPVYGSLLSSNVNVSANPSDYSTSPTNEYGWIQLNLYIEGNNFEDLDCYLVLEAGKDCVVYFDNITIQRTTSAAFDTANSDSDNKTSALSLTPSTSIASTGVANGNFDMVTIAATTDMLQPLPAESWTAQKTNSKNVVAGIVSLSNNYNPADGADDYSNVYYMNAPATVKALDGTTDITDYKNNYSIYSTSTSLSASSVYEISFKFYKKSGFKGNLFAKLYTGSVDSKNVLTEMLILDGSDDFDDNTWLTYKFYVKTSSSSVSVFIELGISEASGECYFKNVSSKTTTKTFEELKVAEMQNAGISNIPGDDDIYQTLNKVKFINFDNLSFSIHNTQKNLETELYDQKEYTTELTNSTKYTVGSSAVAVASFYDETPLKSYTITVGETKYYVGEIYETESIDETTYYIGRRFNKKLNTFEYSLYSDENLTNRLENVNGEIYTIVIDSNAVKLEVNEQTYNTTTKYKLFKYADFTEVVTQIDDKLVNEITSPTKVVIGENDESTDYNSSETNSKIYNYHFNAKNGYYFVNNIVIDDYELSNTYSDSVMILTNSHNTDYISVSPVYTKTLSTTSFYSLRIYVKTSNFDSESFGLNITVDKVSASWKNVNTHNETNIDDNGFVCYEVLIKTNSDTISSLGVKFELGDENHTGTGYAIVSKVELEKFDNEDLFNHYESFVDEDDSTVIKKYYNTSNKDKDNKTIDDKNNMNWATFFYVFSSILLVATIAVAMVAIILKKHPIKKSEKFDNDHEKDLEVAKSNKKSSTKIEDIISEDDDKSGIV